MGVINPNNRIKQKEVKVNSGLIIKDMLSERGIKQSWIAGKLNISKSTLNTQLSKELSCTNLFKICELLKISPEEVYKRSKKKDTEGPAKNNSVSKVNKRT